MTLQVSDYRLLLYEYLALVNAKAESNTIGEEVLPLAGNGGLF